jgi:hypothetical protein
MLSLDNLPAIEIVFCTEIPGLLFSCHSAPEIIKIHGDTPIGSPTFADFGSPVRSPDLLPLHDSLPVLLSLPHTHSFFPSIPTLSASLPRSSPILFFQSIVSGLRIDEFILHEGNLLVSPSKP